MGGQRHRLHGHLRRLALAAALLLAFAAGAARAQVVLDGTLGAAGALAGPNYAITNTAGRQVGANLFHSFSQFNLASGQSATFSGLPGTANVVGRVTGGSASSIDGTLRSTISGANLWLINPSGIAFGPNAQLDVQGSFHASTASYLKLGANGRFDAANPAASVLTVDAPTAFGFLGAPAPLSVDRSQLKVPLGATLSLVGGDITVNGTAAAQVRLEAPGGRINIGSLAAAGEVTLGAGGISSTAAGAAGSMNFTHAFVGTDEGTGARNPGPIYIRGGRLALEQATLSTLRFLPGAGSPIDISLDGDFAMSGGVVRATSVGFGDAGNVTLRAANVSLSGGALIDTSAIALIGGSIGGGRAGQSTVEATGDVALSGASRLTSITFLGSGPAGEMRVTARNLTLTEGSSLSASTFGNGAGGRISITAASLRLGSGGRITTSSEFDVSSTPGTGRGGDIAVNATGTVDVSGPGSGLFSQTETFGDGGTIRVTASDIRVASGGLISTASTDPHQLTAGNAGAINLTARNAIRLESGGAITTQSVAAGGGTMILVAGNLLSVTDSRITTSVADGTGNGGDINIDPVFVVLNNGRILAQATGGNGGDITIITNFLIVSPPDTINENINASSDRGISGTIVISSPSTDVGTRLAALPSSYVDASSLLREACGARAVGNSFTGVGRGGLPAAPGAAAFAAYGFGMAQRTAQEPAPLVLSSNPVRNASLLLSCPG